MQITFRTLTKTLLTPVLCLSLPLGAVSIGCKSEETPPPLPTAKPATSPTAVDLEIEEEDAGAEEETPKKTGGGIRRGGPLSACCSALTQNAANLSEPSKGHMLTAAAACNAANGAGTAPGAFFATLGGLLRGAPIPPACR